ncbi:MAG: YlbF family regulator [Phycisphaeraceae bacterium]
MASTDQILQKARELGELISKHESAKKLEDVLKRLEQDSDAQRVLNDYNRHLQALSEKQQQGQPIEVEDKHKLEQLQKQVVTNKVLRDFQSAQMDYVDLMRRVDEAMGGQTPGAAGGGAEAAAASPLVNPDLSNLTGQG